MLARSEVAKVSNEATGCTSVIQSYNISPSVIDANNHSSPYRYTFWDTPGLQGNVSTQNALSSLYQLAPGQGVNLIMYCVAGSRSTDMIRVNYDLFWGIIYQGRVPIVLVVTGLELESDMDQWWKKNEEAVLRLGMIFEGHACVTTIRKSNLYEEKFRMSEEKVWKLVQEHCNPVPWNPSQDWLSKIPCRVDKYMKILSARSGTERKLLPGHTRTKLAKVHTRKLGGQVLVRSMLRGMNFVLLMSDSQEPLTHNIILFGEVGSGKSSIVNLIIGKDVAKVSNSTLGCTFEIESYPTRIGNTSYYIFDTVGLNGGDSFRVPQWAAIQGLYTLVRQLSGVSLFIFCIRGRILEKSRVIWLFFLDVLCGGNVPIIAVVTGLEHEDNLTDEARRNEVIKAFNAYHIYPVDVALVVSIWGKNNEHAPKYKWSQKKLRDLIDAVHRREPWGKEKDEWFSRIYKKAYDHWIDSFRRPQLKFIAPIRKTFEEFSEKSDIREDDFNKLAATLSKAEKRIQKKKHLFHT